jgi:DNA-binding NtrC family response regulator
VTDAEGYVQAAQGGTLFLDEIGDIEGSVQPKLLRLLEAGEVFELGASRPRKVDVRVCAATLKDLRAEVQSGRFREDLFYRIGRPVIGLPPLSERLEELPWLVEVELCRVEKRIAASASFLEVCALRAWPGNVRELRLEMRQAMRAALDDGREALEPGDLSPSAGKSASATAARRSERTLTREVIEAALQSEHGNVTAAARRLGLHRTQLRRWLARSGVDTGTLAAEYGEVRASGIVVRPPSRGIRPER